MKGGGAKKRGRKMEFIIERYEAAHPELDGGPTEPHLIAPWAMERGLWNKPPTPPVEILRRELSRYLKNQYIEDPQNRLVRKFHAVPLKIVTPDGSTRRMSSWHMIYETPKKKMLLSLQMRRRSAVRDVVQLDLDLGSYNDNNIFGETLPPMDFNLNPDVAESKMPGHYGDEPDEDDGPGDPEAGRPRQLGP